MNPSVFYFLSSMLIGSVFSYPTNVPEGACVSMTPGHGTSAQKNASPYKIEASPKIVRQGDLVQVVLYGSEPFKGFYLQARDQNGTPIGSFTRNDIVKTHNCGNGEKNAAFHGVRGLKNNLEIYWTAPKDFTGQVTFTSSFVSEFEKFWTFVRANPITVKA